MESRGVRTASRLAVRRRAQGLFAGSLLLGALGCQAPDIVERALLEAQDSQVMYREAELEQLARSRSQRLRDYEQAISRQETKYEELCAANVGLKREITSGEAQVAQLRTELQQTVAQRDAAAGEVNQAREQVAALTKEREQLAALATQEQQNLVALRERRAELTSQVAAVQVEMERVQGERRVVEHQLATQRDELAALTARRDGLASDRVATATAVAQLEAEVVARRAEIERLKAEREEQFTAVARLETEAGTLVQRKQGLQNQLVNEATEIAMLEERMTILRERTSSARARKDALELELARVEIERTHSQQALQQVSRNESQAEAARQAREQLDTLRQRALEIGQQIAGLEKHLTGLQAPAAGGATPGGLIVVPDEQGELARVRPGQPTVHAPEALEAPTRAPAID